MKRWLKGLAAAVLCAAVMLAVMPAAQGAPVYFMAANDTLQPLSAANMPTTVGGVLYVPYTLLSSNETGVNLGVYATYSSVRGSVLVYSSRQQLIFNLHENQTYDLDGNLYYERAVMRNSTVYIPLALVCSVFDEIYYSVSSTSYGYLVRVKSSAAVLGDEAFITAAANMMQGSLNRYLVENPEPEASQPPSEPGISGSGAGVYLAFTLSETAEVSAEGVETDLEQVIAALEEEGCQALFFFTPEQFAQRDDLVRRLLGLGHLVGARLSAGNGKDALTELEQASGLLAEVARCRLSLVLAEGLDEEETARVEQEGYTCWGSTVDGRELEGSGSSRASALIRRLTRGEAARNYVLLSDETGRALSTMLSAVERADFQFRAPVAPAL